MAWQLAIGLNLLIAVCYVLISGLIMQGLIRTKQVSTNALAVATSAIFMTCAIHHGHHALHLMHGGSAGELLAVRAVFGNWHTMLVDGIGAAVAVAYLGLRQSYKTLLHTPAMFEDAVRVAAERQLREQAFRDVLTGIPNRAAYQAHADEVTRSRQPSTVLFVDLDGFKAINDEHGHDTGDRLLREAAERMAAALRDDEAVFRLGGDEFVLVAVGHDAAAGRHLVERVNAALLTPFAVRESTVVVSASIGVASGSGDVPVDQLTREADAGMYRIKKARVLPPPPRAPEAPALHRAAG